MVLPVYKMKTKAYYNCITESHSTYLFRKKQILICKPSSKTINSESINILEQNELSSPSNAADFACLDMQPQPKKKFWKSCPKLLCSPI